MPAAAVHNLFATTIQKTEEWIHDLMRELDWQDPREAYAALRATLHALRDCLTVDESAQLAAQLPLLLRGVYYEGWNPRAKSKHIRRLDEFEARIHWESRRPYEAPLDRVVRAVFTLLSQRISAGEITDVIRVLPEELRGLWPA